ncbi:ribosome-binding factor A [Candidatus Velamenicoccus archaeovorus]|uniref:Ribosome-binding factor A n=1 Tax=Velamenicoccus archaeovorus TaxID=1930593 RepID=A0A410P592_VELA1|nr:30S ribosome-binding factor RbfA [Candidatus Velamenicoccus archaeovorus]QAT17282.1 ribosome-binding factor A [Candidatus Velamenicoccus archaeovorus]
MSRKDKVAGEIKKIVSTTIQEEIRDPRLGFTTITRVEVTPDLSFARIYFSVYGSPEQWEETLKGLEHASGYIRRALGQELSLRFVPEIAFKADHSPEYSIMIEQQLQEIKKLEQETAQPRKKARGPQKTHRRTKEKES